ncbi:signal recognition particle 68 isoform X2 [Arctopsyche grandis]|uniref:signal recognition particle 68 isoform X2 n=1 Tax=Arctopsyche grandis TaxID=121162 RepID=UPI00406D95FC
MPRGVEAAAAPAGPPESSEPPPAQPPPPEEEPSRTNTFTIEILRIIRDAQQQHGLRHGDYQRYRGYCTRRIQRLRKVLKLPQGDRRHYKRKDVTVALLGAARADERLLRAPLILAERCWAHAMQLRQESNTEPRKRFHLVSRLRKACVYALQLQELCDSPHCDARTKLEAQAYVAWIHGSLHFELQLWKPAAENLKKAQVVYEKLLATLSEDEQLIYKQKIDELAPSLRYCAYNIGDKSAIDDLLQMRGQGMVDNLDALMAQARESRVGSLQEVEWRGRRITVRPEKTRLFLLALQDLDKTVERAPNCLAKIELIENALMDCKDAISAVKDEVKMDPKLRSSSGAPLPGVQNLLSYLTYVRLTRTIERNQYLVDQAREALENKTQLEGKKVRPHDLTRLYEIILQTVNELQSLVGFEDDAVYQKEIVMIAKAYKAFRCFYIAEVLLTLRRWSEAFALYDRANTYATDCLSKKLEDKKLSEKLEALKKSIISSKCSAHAQSILADEDDEAVTQSGKRQKHKKPLVDRLTEYAEDSNVLTKNPNVFKLPPEMEAIPCKPLFFDLACNFVEFPSLEDKMGNEKKQGAGLTGFVKGFLGWGGK